MHQVFHQLFDSLDQLDQDQYIIRDNMQGILISILGLVPDFLRQLPL